ncbi:MAG TPA: phosphonate C-P lyase system protein PhnH [Pseudorhizobium sp.]|nr:phosphonate C-P lyase system protein PhnH [Pseudorhizobium sp.]
MKNKATIKVTGLPEYFEEIWRGNRALFPRGVDVILAAGRTLVCLPRTTTIA